MFISSQMCCTDLTPQLKVSTSKSDNVVYAFRVSTYNTESWVEVDIAEYNEWKRKQEEEEKRLAEQYGMPYEEEDNEEENSIK